ncbi:TauD/TfdA family dioxygenase [Microbulbifer sp. THAF38]|uniref:TauD/TfdA family dioxygenase n=1 Tax=Microbulbifer sp. THAF38 TaxID=2587856 RepID=UPI0012689B51|nr:TauD/TfdA family dioxygenase [Microbulbifer sp. THAF38]QFT54269.1 Taurine catabolism dioxygenase TauD, TfdA family [Microbulbifer sp. THAF38]
MIEMAPAEAVRAQAWAASEMTAKSNWKFSWPVNWQAEIKALQEWSKGQEDPIQALRADSVSTPQFDQLAYKIKHEVQEGSGITWIQGVEGFDQKTLNLLFLNLSLAMGQTIDTYGRLYGILDTGRSYKEEAIPVSQTNAATGVHTDSSQRAIQPNILGLCCITPAIEGGKSKVVSAAQVHKNLEESAPQQLELLYNNYIRDLVTPGSDKDLQNILNNHFPIFSYVNGRLSIRYMRYWIEKGHQRVDKPLTPEVLQALDMLDGELNNEENVVSFYMNSGDMIFIDNTRVLHDRDEFIDTPDQKRVYTRVWID